jgi:hypothetical protein
MTRFRVSRALVLVCSVLQFPIVSAVHAAGPGQSGTQLQPPANIHVDQVLAPVFEELLQASPTFAAQIQRVEEVRYVHVAVNPVLASSMSSRGSARSTMRRFSSGALLASVDIPVPLTMVEYAELFGHEFEHIIEQIDGVDLAALTRGHDGATRLADGAYETTRAHRTGRVVADESERPRPVPLQPHAATPASAPLRRPERPDRR